jgi:hypothetical protein
MNLSLAIAALVFITTTSAQWINLPTPGIPRTADGKADLNAPAPRQPDGKPDLSGIWRQPDGVKYTINLAADLKPDQVPYRPQTEAVYKHNQETLSKDDPVGHCMLAGVPQMNAVPYPYKILNAPGMVVILYEALRTYRQIFLDGRPLPKDANPQWMGYSTGHWDGDTLVVESGGFNDKSWLDSGGRPHSDALHVTERFHRRDFGHIELQTTIDDPKAYTKPWTVSYELRLMPDTDLLEYVCEENNKDVEHLVGK